MPGGKIRVNGPHPQGCTARVPSFFLLCGLLFLPVTTANGCVAAPGYTCYSGFCASDAARHNPPPQCGPELAEITLVKGLPWADQVDAAAKWCSTHAACSGFALDPSNAKWLAFAASNFTAAAQPNSGWTAWWRGAPQPLPPARPPAPPPAPPPWVPILPAGECATDEDCSLNGVCGVSSRADSGRVGRACDCYASWTGA